MSNQYMYNYQQPSSSSQYSPSLSHNNTSPTFNYDSTFSTSVSSTSSSSSYSYHTPRMRYYLSKSFDVEDDMEFCPEIPESFGSPNAKKFNPYTATIFSPTAQYVSETQQPSPTSLTGSSSPRVHTPRIKKPLEIINPQTKMRVESPATK